VTRELKRMKAERRGPGLSSAMAATCPSSPPLLPTDAALETNEELRWSVQGLRSKKGAAPELDLEAALQTALLSLFPDGLAGLAHGRGLTAILLLMHLMGFPPLEMGTRDLDGRVWRLCMPAS